MNRLDPDNLNAIEFCFEGIQKNILNKLKIINDSKCNVVVDKWKREQGGGGKSISLEGKIIEKAAVNFSSISGKKLPSSSIASSTKSKTSSWFHAVGVFYGQQHWGSRLFLGLGCLARSHI